MTSQTGEPQAAPALPWPEPWRAQPHARPSSQYWDVTSACWHCDDAPASGPVPAPRGPGEG